MTKETASKLTTHPTLRWQAGRKHLMPEDCISPELPLAIRITIGGYRRASQQLAITMRSPGQDEELSIGYLFSEGIIGQIDDIINVQIVDENHLEIQLHPSVDFDPDLHVKSSFSNSACGLCSKTSLDQLDQTTCYFPKPGMPIINPIILTQLLDVLYQQQSLFKLTGGMHAAALFDNKGQLLLVCEDVGRHNAMDKLLGASLKKGILPWRDEILLTSSRLSYELVQKAAMAGTPILAALGAPTTLAIEMAEQSGMTLVGFLRNDRFNVYTYPDRINSK